MQSSDSRRWITRLLSLTVATAGLTVPAAAQEPAGRDALRLPMPPSLRIASRGALAAPAVSIGAPTGFGASFGDAFVGVGVQSRTRFAERADGGVVAGIGLGDPRRYVGLEVAASTFGTFRSCCRGGLSLKAHRLLPGAMSVAVGWENVVGWGHLEQTSTAPDAVPAGFTDGGSSVYAAITRVFGPGPASRSNRSITTTIGVGSGRFRREGDILSDRDGVNVFGSLGVRLAEPVSAVATWTGQDLNAGVSVVPIRRGPLVVTLGAADLTTRPRALLGVGFGFAYPY